MMWIKSKIALSLKALQKRCVTTDTVVTSDDADANLLCCALEAVFIHGIKSKYIRTEVGGRGRKVGPRGPLPQPVFWTLLKSVTHRDVISELENLNFINTDVGRCRAWVRLALNDGLVECYLASLLRENSKLVGYYQPTALMLDPEEREVLLSYLQGLGSLTFQLSYKSAVLNEWTATPLALAGLCPADSVEPPPPTAGSTCPQAPKRKESWDTVSQSSGSSDVVEVQRGPGRPVVSAGGRTQLTSSNLSLDTTGSSQLSSSLSSDSLLQGNGHKSPDKEPWLTDLDITAAAEDSGKALQQCPALVGFAEATHFSEESMQDESGLSSLLPEHLSEVAASSGSDSDPQQPQSLLGEPEHPAPCETARCAAPNDEVPNREASSIALLRPPPQRPEVQLQAPCPEGPVRLQRSESTLSRKTSVESLHSPTSGFPKCRSWISEDDFYKPQLEEAAEPEEGPCPSAEQASGTPSPIMELQSPQSPPSVVHRRQMGLSNPFRGLLKLGHLERRGAVGIWRRYYCELSPFELRLYQNDEERTCCENCSLLRCEDICTPTPEGRFELAFPGRRLLLRAASRDEAEDWVDRIVEAVNKCRQPAHRDDEWQVLEASAPPPDTAVTPGKSTPPSPEHAAPELVELDWTRPTEPEPDAIKEAVLYQCVDDWTWTPLIFSLSLEALKVFQVQEGRKVLRFTHPIECVRDVVPDALLGSPAFFKVLTARETLKLRAQSEQEARSWRGLIRGALDSYLDTCEDAASAGVSSQGGNIHRLVQHSLREDATLLPHLYTVPTEKGLDAQNFKCAGCPKQIGFSFGKARLCEFSGQYYCESCHHGDTIIIPSRVVHNWDLVARE
ncbi:pleckstrin-like domain-containing family M member 1-like, partial [Scleropages formosus]